MRVPDQAAAAPLRLVLAAANLASLTAGQSYGWETFDFALYRLQAAIRADGRFSRTHVVVDELPDAEPEALADRLLRHQPDVVGLSAYVWSFPILIEVAREIKARCPATIVVMGGPSARPAMFDLPAFRGFRSAVDAVCVGDGEATLCELLALEDLTPDTLSEIAGLAVPSADGWRNGARRPRMERLDDLASPYQFELVPSGVSAILETFRGCPISCRFCEWGVMESPRSVFSVEYLKRELEGIRRTKAPTVICADAGLNLNARAFRNLAAAEAEVGLFRETSLSCCVYPSHLKDEHLAFLDSIQIGRVALGLQSFNSSALEAMDRPFDPKRFDGAIGALAKNGRTVIELIAGLPGDDYRNFGESFERALSYGCDVVVSHCLVLPDGLMTRAPADACMDFDAHTLKMKSCKGWPPGEIEKILVWCGEHAGASH